jgi:hypothetical protein
MVDVVVVPVVGMGTTGIHDLGRTPYTIIEVVDRKTLRIQEDQAFRIGNSRVDAQEYRYEANPKGIIKTITLRERGLWYEVGKGPRGSYPFQVGVRRKFQDFSTALANLWKSNRA